VSLFQGSLRRNGARFAARCSPTLETKAQLGSKQAVLTIARKLIRRAHHTLRELGDEALQPVPPT
jgi:hypothetical protein